jgi:hypothetical protein
MKMDLRERTRARAQTHTQTDPLTACHISAKYNKSPAVTCVRSELVST